MARKRKPGRPKGTGTTGIGTLIGVRAHSPFLDTVDKWRLKQQVAPSRAAAVRRLAEIGVEVEQARAARRRPVGKKAASQASQMAGEEIDRLGDRSATPEEREKRKRRLLRGPNEFRELRDDVSKRNREK